MTARPNPPLLTPAQAADLLEHVLFEQILECLDLDAIYRLEQSLTMLVGELEGVPEDKVADTTKAMLDRVLVRLPDNLRTYLNAASWIPGCVLCEDEHDSEPRRPGKAGDPRAPIRFNS